MGMNTPDDFSQYHAELLEGVYDCVDRIVLNAFFPMGQTGGGMRCLWRQLHGDDSHLDDKHLRLPHAQRWDDVQGPRPKSLDRRSSDQQKNRLVKRLADLGYAVEIKPLAATA